MFALVPAKSANMMAEKLFPHQRWDPFKHVEQSNHYTAEASERGMREAKELLWERGPSGVTSDPAKNDAAARSKIHFTFAARFE